MNSKYKMTLEQNIFLAKKNIIDYIWKSANLEGINVTFPETYAIYEGAKVSGIKVDDIITINNLKNAWKYLLANIEEEMKLGYICKLNDYVSHGESLEWGKLRSGSVGISGTDYTPPIPKYETAENELKNILTIRQPTDRALTLMLWGMRSQLFWDGNKRTSMLAANKIMIENGCGVISVKQDDAVTFNTLLSEYYTTNDMSKIKSFLYEHSIDGIEFKQDKEINEELER